MIKKFEMNVDGASRGNPGPAAIGITIKDENKRLVASIREKIGVTTNNQAEYKALITGLKKAINLGVEQITVFSDSELMVNQMRGIYRVKNANIKPLYSEAVRLAYSLAGFQIVAVPREQNLEADKLANLALDS